MPVVLLFHGSGDSKYAWDRNNSEFIKHLKKLDLNIYNYTAKWNNFVRYFDKKHRDEFDDKFDFTYDYLDIPKHCELIYQDIAQKFPNEKIIVIAHSFGNLLAQTFAKLYPAKCKFIIIVDGMLLGKYFAKFNAFKHKDIDPDKFNTLMKHFENKKSPAEKLYKICYQIMQNYNAKHDFTHLAVPTIYFRDYDIERLSDPTYRKFIQFQNAEIENYKKHNKNFKCVYFTNKGHYPHYDKESQLTILQTIQLLLK